MNDREERIEALYQKSTRWLAARIVDLVALLLKVTEATIATHDKAVADDTPAATPDRVWLDAEEVRVVVQALACL